MEWSLVLSTKYDINDPRRFKMGTPAEVASTMERAWTVEPTMERVREDISALPRVLDRIIEVKGDVVPEINFRSGRRVVKSKVQTVGII